MKPLTPQELIKQQQAELDDLRAQFVELEAVMAEQQRFRMVVLRELGEPRTLTFQERMQQTSSPVRTGIGLSDAYYARKRQRADFGLTEGMKDKIENVGEIIKRRKAGK